MYSPHYDIGFPPKQWSKKMSIYLSNVRLSFPHLTQPQISKKFPDNAPNYGADFILEENHPDWVKFMQAFATLAQERYKDKAQQVMQMIHNDRKSRCYGSGSEKVNGKTLEVYSGYAGKMFISAKNKNQPQIVDSTGAKIDNANSMLYRDLTSKMYAGCRVNAVINPWLKVTSNGIGCDLVAIQFAGDDQPFGEAAPDVTNLFGAVAVAAGPTPAPAPAMGLPPFMQAK
jgi:hypothetical protein